MELLGDSPLCGFHICENSSYLANLCKAQQSRGPQKHETCRLKIQEIQALNAPRASIKLGDS